MPRIALAGFQHETNSFGIGRAGLAEFEMADSWPALLSGSEVLSGTHGMNLPIAGFAEAAQAEGADLRPILWCAAEPSGAVTDQAFETITERILDGIRASGPIDGLYLDLHGAMITDSHADGEGALLERIRAVTGPSLPIAVSLDMHANVSDRMVGLADVICIFRTYPHLDMALTGARAWTRLRALLGGNRPARAFRQAPFLVPLHAQTTDVEPARSLCAELPDASDAHVELAFGFTAADGPDTGPSVIASAPEQSDADTQADAALQRLLAARDAFQTGLAFPADAVAQAMVGSFDKPVVLADVQDNPGAGASSDTTGILRALVDAGAQGTLLGLMHDPAMVAKAHAAGSGATIKGSLGGRSGVVGDAPYHGRFRVGTLSTGTVPYTGAMYGGGIATLGPSCVLHIEGADISIVVTGIRNQCLDLAQFTHFGLDPRKAKIIVVKSTAHFRADFEPIAAKVIPVAAPGLFPCDLPMVKAAQS